MQDVAVSCYGAVDGFWQAYSAVSTVTGLSWIRQSAERVWQQHDLCTDFVQALLVLGLNMSTKQIWEGQRFVSQQSKAMRYRHCGFKVTKRKGGGWGGGLAQLGQG